MALSATFYKCFVGSEALEGLESTAEVVCGEEVSKMLPELVVGFVVAAFDGRALDRSVHPFDLPVGPGVARLGEPVVDVVLRACEREGVAAEALACGDRRLDLFDRGARVLGIDEMDSVVGEHGVHLVRYRGDELPEEVGGDPGGGFSCNLTEANLEVRSIATSR